MKSVMILTLALCLQGCYQAVDSWDIERAIKLCGGVENIVKIGAFFDGDEIVRCKSGVREILKGG